jgi:Asp-tRNA(Asn)/Glu-tRNA(Gln) amidotransferase A subunit family amidase
MPPDAMPPDAMSADAMSRVSAALRRLDAVHARTGCVADRDDDAVLAEAITATHGPLHGEPITVKDWIDVHGFRCSGGETEFAERRPTADATVVARLRAAGAVVIAKTAVGVDSDRFGVVRHPHDSRLSPGGSSSGDGAAVGGGAVRIGIGSDSGGSVRVPAAWCGVVGLKPSAGLVPLSGHFPYVGDRGDGRTVIGPLAATVALAWRAVSVMAGADDVDGGTAPVPLGDPRTVDVSSLRAAVGTPAGQEVSPAVAAALDVARDAVQAAGATVVGPPPSLLGEARRITEAYWARRRRTGAQVDQDLEDWDRFRERASADLRGLDVVIQPTVAHLAPAHRDMTVDDYIFCLPASLTGAPAISVPVGDAAVQVVAPRWADHVAVAVAAVIEAAARDAR